MKIVLLGANSFTFNLSKLLQAEKHDILVVSNLTQLNKQISTEETLAQALQSAGITIQTIDSVTDFDTFELPEKTSLVLSYGAPWILPDRVIKTIFDNKVINIHGTHLPKYRGGTLFSWQILTGQRTGMCLLHQLTADIDAGPILAFEEFIYPAHCRKPIDYIQVYENHNLQFVMNFVSNWKGWPQHKTQQPEYLSSYFPRLMAPVHGWINWSWSNIELERFILAFDEPYGGARCKLNGETVIIRDVYAQQTDGYFHPFQYGMIYRNNGAWVTVATHQGELLIKSVLNDAGENITSRIKVGDKFYTTEQELSSTHQRVIKTKNGLTTREKR